MSFFQNKNLNSKYQTYRFRANFLQTFIYYIIPNLNKYLFLNYSLFDSFFSKKNCIIKKIKNFRNNRLGQFSLILALTFSEKATIENNIL